MEREQGSDWHGRLRAEARVVDNPPFNWKLHLSTITDIEVLEFVPLVLMAPKQRLNERLLIEVADEMTCMATKLALIQLNCDDDPNRLTEGALMKMVRERRKVPDENASVRGSEEVNEPESDAAYNSLVLLKTNVRADARRNDKTQKLTTRRDKLIAIVFIALLICVEARISVLSSQV